MRVYEIAKKLDTDSMTVVDGLRTLGIYVRSFASKVEPIFAETFIAWWDMPVE